MGRREHKAAEVHQKRQGRLAPAAPEWAGLCVMGAASSRQCVRDDWRAAGGSSVCLLLYSVPGLGTGVGAGRQEGRSVPFNIIWVCMYIFTR